MSLLSVAVGFAICLIGQAVAALIVWQKPVRQMIALAMHRHDWVVVWRGQCTLTRRRWLPNGKRQKLVHAPNTLILLRCHCGCEKAQEFKNEQWESVDLLWLNEELNRLGVKLPCRHEE